jgi:hypothetical protein
MNATPNSAPHLKIRRFAKQTPFALFALFVMSVYPLRALAQEDHSHQITSQQGELSPDKKVKASALVKVVRENTERFKDVADAERAHYSLLFGCVSGPDAGAMGLHYVNMDLLDEVNKTGVFDPARPQIVIYEPTPNGRPRLLGADFLVFADAWTAKHPEGPPELMGQLFHLFESPNRFGLPAFYTLHVWAWKQNPKGSFVNWHPDVSCEPFAGQAH